MNIHPSQLYTSRHTKKNLLRILNMYQSAIDLNIICSITDIGGTIIYVNNKFCEKSGYTEQELLGQNHNIVNSGYHPKSFFTGMWNTILNGNTWQGEVKCRKKDNSFFWLHRIIIPVFDDNREIIHFFSIRTSIDEKKQAEKKQEDYIKSLEEMLFMTSHHVRQPITHILGLSNVFSDLTLSQDDLKYTMTQIQQSANSLDTFTKELTNFISEAKEYNKTA